MRLEEGIGVVGGLSAARALLSMPGKGGGGGGARRNLFGTRPDGAGLREELGALLRESLDAARSRWAFDFSSDTPLPGGGDFEWEAVRARDVPALYRERVAGGEEAPRAGCEQEAETPGQTAAGAGEQSPQANGGDGCPGPARKRRRLQQQARITDFFSSKKVKTSPTKRVTHATQRSAATVKLPAL